MAKKKDKKSSFDLTQMSVEGIIQAKEEVQNLLAALEDEHRTATISDKSYNELKEKNTKKFEEIKAFLIDMGMRDIADAPPKPKEDEKKPSELPASVGGTPEPASLAPAAMPAAPVAASAAQTSAINEVQVQLVESKMKIGIEKINTMIDALKETNKSLEDRLQKMTEGMGEVRSLVFSKESSGKEQEILLKQLREEMDSVDPRKIEKDFGKRDKLLTEYNMRIERSESKTDNMLKSLKDIQGLLRSIGNLENISTVNKDISLKMEEIENISKTTNRLSDKVQKIFIDLNRKLELFMKYKSKQDSLDELSKELMKTVDGLTVKIEDFVEKTDLESLQNDIFGLGNKIDEMKNIVDVIVPIININIPEPIQKLRKEKETIEGVLNSLEESYKNQKIKKPDYLSAREKNKKNLEKLDRKLKKEWANLQDSMKGKKVDLTGGSQKTEVKTETKTPEKQDEKKSEQKTEEKKGAKKGEKSSEKKTEEKKEEKTTEKTVEEKKETEKPKEEKKEDKTTEKTEEKPKEEPKKEDVVDENQRLLDDLKDSFDNDLISKEVYEQSKKIILEQ